MTDAAPIKVWSLPPLWGTPSPSPFAIKLMTWLRMADIPYVAPTMMGPPRSRTKKIPYIELENGETVADSSQIIERLTRDRGIALDDGLDTRQRALAHTIRRTVEEHLYSAGDSRYRPSRDCGIASRTRNSLNDCPVDFAVREIELYYTGPLTVTGVSLRLWMR